MHIVSLLGPDFPEPADSPTVEIRYPLRYPDRRTPIEYRWRVPRSRWEAALELLDEEPSLDYLTLLDRATGTLDRLAWWDGHDFGSEERRDALRRLYRLLMPASLWQKLGFDHVLLGARVTPSAKLSCVRAAGPASQGDQAN